MCFSNISQQINYPENNKMIPAENAEHQEEEKQIIT